jgi:hypothetical protein
MAPPSCRAQDSRQADVHRAAPGGETPAGTLDGVQLAQGTLGRDAGTHPGPAAARGGQEQSHSRPPPGEAVRIWPHEAGIRRRCEGQPSATLGLPSASLPRRSVSRAGHRPGNIIARARRCLGSTSFCNVFVARRIPRPFAGTLARPFAGTLARPFAGTLARPFAGTLGRRRVRRGGRCGVRWLRGSLRRRV